MNAFPEALRHGHFTEVFPDVFMIVGSFKLGPSVTITRNMTVVRQRGELVVINSVRLTPEGEAELESLGAVKHLVRIGAAHGADDPYYVHRYQTTLWAPPRMRHKRPELRTDEELVPGHTPIDGSTVFLFERGRRPEAALILNGGILLTCDAYQHWTSFDGCSFAAKLVARAMGFGPAVIGGPWSKMMGPSVRSDFERLLEHDFRHLVPGHGSVLRDTAKTDLRAAMLKRFGG